MFKQKSIFFIAAVLLTFTASFCSYAEESTSLPIHKTFTTVHQSSQTGFHQMIPYYMGGPYVFDIRDNILNGESNKRMINAFNVNPAGFSFALSYDERNPRLYIYSNMAVENILDKVKLETPVSAIFFAPDAKYVAICDSEAKVTFINTTNYEPYRIVEGDIVADEMIVSDNGYYVALLKDGVAEIMDIETWTLKKKFDGPSKVTSIAFSKNGDFFAVTTDDGKLGLYDAHSFKLFKEYSDFGEARACAINRDGKYVAVITSDTHITVQNRLFDPDRYSVDYDGGGLDMITFVTNSFGEDFIAFHNPHTTGYARTDILSPYYGMLISGEMSERMDSWMKQMEGESLEDYRLRVNDETRAKQMAFYEQEIATRMAEGMLGEATASLGGYNMETSVLTINFDTMPSIFLTIPENQVADFSDIRNLKFSNAQYAVMDNDNFELVYLEVLNTVTGKSYSFDNRERKALDFLQIKEDFVPLDIIQMSNMEEKKLEAIKEEVVTAATETKTISNHTNISVLTHVDTDYNADGKKILNYRVGVNYDVETEFSEKEDFGPGKYRPEESGAASSMLEIIRKAFETDFAQYMKPGKKVRVTITGMADNTPIVRTIAYDESFGKFVNQPVWSNGSLTAVTLTKEGGISENKQLAFVRAAGLKKYIQDNVKQLSEMDCDYQYNAEVSEHKGAEFRRISVEFVFIDAF